MTSSTCIGEPISWLRLEQYALGEAKDHDEIARHVAACAACREALAQIESDAGVVPVPVPALPPPPSRTATTALRPPAWRRAVLASGSALALAAAVVLVLGHREVGNGGGGVDRVKGVGVGFELVRDDDMLLAEAGGTFKDGDRFKALVSCAPGARVRFDLVVYDDAAGLASFPLDVPEDFACGNGVPLPGAFRLRGQTPLRVCLAWAEDAPDRDALARMRTVGAVVGPRFACKELLAEP